MHARGINEREIIAILKRRFDTDPKLPLGFDDDVSAIPYGRHQLYVLKTDTLVGKTDVPPGMTLGQAARKAVVGTVSDFASKGVKPKALLTTLGLPRPVKPENVNLIARGLFEGANEYGCRIIGGDTCQTDDLIIDCIGFGLAHTAKILRRDGARPGDIVATTGDFGKTSVGLRLLLSKNKRAMKSYPTLIRSVLHPVAKLSIGLKLADTRKVTSSIDSSDGLAWSLHEIARLGEVNIALDRIPVAPQAQSYARAMGLDPIDLAMFGGEEYELVVTIKKH